MLALALQLGADPARYDQPDSPVQRAIFSAVSRFCGLPAEELSFGIDGCGVPTFALPVSAMARMFARFVAAAGGGEGPDSEDAAAARSIVAAMNARPEMVEGEGELDTEVMRAARGRLVSKVGAEGVYCAGLLPCERWPRGLGLAFKIEDGDKGDRARPRAAVEALRQLGAFDEEGLRALSKFSDVTLKNHRGDAVGQALPAFRLGL
jgi:L-asparaginase II